MNIIICNMAQFDIIREIYETMNIYKSVLVYVNDDEFSDLRNILIENDYPLVQSDKDKGRMYCLKAGSDDSMIEWDTISVVFAIGDEAFDFAKELSIQTQREEYILLVRI